MSTLGDAVVERLVRKQLTVSRELVDETLSKAGIATSATSATPVSLRVLRLHFWGTKNTGEAFTFTWEPKVGVNGIGSGRNLRGKTTVLNMLVWALTGRRPNLQSDIQAWMRHVEVDWEVGQDVIAVAFDVANGHPVGEVQLIGTGRRTVLNTFSDEDDFETAMSEIMMSRLRLEPIRVWTESRTTTHGWPAYASALMVRSNTLDPIVGNETTIGLRMMQMFLGTEWAPASAVARTAVRELTSQRTASDSQGSVAEAAVSANRKRAEDQLRLAEQRLAELNARTPEVTAVFQAADEASALAHRIGELEGKLLTARSVADTSARQCKAERARRHAILESTLALRFFNSMAPTVCPRCTAAVTKERRDAEPEQHTCSVCTSGLDLQALEANVIVAASVSAETRTKLVGAVAVDGGRVEAEGGDGEPDPVDELVALEQATAGATSVVAALESEIAGLRDQRDVATAVVAGSLELREIIDEQRAAELAVAKAEGALDALSDTFQSPTDPGDGLVATIIETADSVIKQWVKENQDPRLRSLSVEIETLARSFGCDTFGSVYLNGSANMSLTKGGQNATYSKLTAGEKLRLKIATAIALIKIGASEGIGRHPGLLLIDSPGAEEIPDDDLEIMLTALVSVAESAQMQIFVATTKPELLSALLPPEQRVLAIGDGYVW